MTTESGLNLTNPAAELFNLIEPWALVPAGKTSLDLRGPDYEAQHLRANELLEQVRAYVHERAQLSGRGRTPGAKQLAGL